jgi:hypothetical protein
MPLLTFTVLAAFPEEAPMRADDARGEPERHLARLELIAEREHFAAVLVFIRADANRLRLGAAETSRLERKQHEHAPATIAPVRGASVPVT